MKFRESILHFGINKVIKKRKKLKLQLQEFSQQLSGQYFIDSHLNPHS